MGARFQDEQKKRKKKKNLKGSGIVQWSSSLLATPRVRSSNPAQALLWVLLFAFIKLLCVLKNNKNITIHPYGVAILN